MPIYEFYSPDNNKLYQFFARSQAYRETTPLCPENPSFRMEKQLSRFAIIGKAKEQPADDPFAHLDDSQLEGIMTQMDGEMNAMDDENPDPRQLGRFMRKMTDLLGSKAPPQLLDAVKRLEAGEDPQKLEAEFGGEAGADNLFAQAKKIMASRPPIRDPKLYEMADYLHPSQA